MSYKADTPIGIVPYSFTPTGELVVLLWKSSTSTFTHSSLYYGECSGVKDRQDDSMWDVCARTWAQISGGVYQLSEDMQKKREKKEKKQEKGKKQTAKQEKSSKSKSSKSTSTPTPTPSDDPSQAFHQSLESFTTIDDYSPPTSSPTTAYSTKGNKYREFSLFLSTLTPRKMIASSIKSVRKMLTSRTKNIITWSNRNPSNPRFVYLVPVEYLPIWKYNAYYSKFGRGECQWVSIIELIRIATLQFRVNSNIPPYDSISAKEHDNIQKTLLTATPFMDQECMMEYDDMIKAHEAIAPHDELKSNDGGETGSGDGQEHTIKKVTGNLPITPIPLSLSFLSMLSLHNMIKLMKLAKVSKKIFPPEVYSIFKAENEAEDGELNQDGETPGIDASSAAPKKVVPTLEQISALEEDIKRSNYIYKCRGCRKILFTEADISLHQPFSLEHHTQKALDRVEQREKNKDTSRFKKEIRSINRSITLTLKKLTRVILRQSTTHEGDENDDGDHGGGYDDDSGEMYEYVFSDDDEEDEHMGDDEDEDDYDDDDEDEAFFLPDMGEAFLDQYDDSLSEASNDDGPQDPFHLPYRRLLGQIRQHHLDVDISPLERSHVEKSSLTAAEYELRAELLDLRNDLVQSMIAYRQYLENKDTHEPSIPSLTEDFSHVVIDPSQPEVYYTERELIETLPTYRGQNSVGAGLYVKPVFQKNSQKGFTSKAHSSTAIQTASDITPTSLCQSFFLDNSRTFPFLKPMLELDGMIRCASCDYRCGTYNWSGSQCSCGQWIVPGIQIPASRVDTILRSQPKADQSDDIPSSSGGNTDQSNVKVLPKQVGVRRLPAHRPVMKRPS